MKRRVTLRVESLDGRILPGKCGGGGVEVGPPRVAVIDDGGSKPGGTGEGIQILGTNKPGTGGSGPFGGSKLGASVGTNSTGNIELFGGSKPVTNGGSN